MPTDFRTEFEDLTLASAKGLVAAHRGLGYSDYEARARILDELRGVIPGEAFDPWAWQVTLAEFQRAVNSATAEVL